MKKWKLCLVYACVAMMLAGCGNGADAAISAQAEATEPTEAPEKISAPVTTEMPSTSSGRVSESALTEKPTATPVVPTATPISTQDGARASGKNTQSDLPEAYVALCNERIEESQEALDNIMASARENVFYIAKAYAEIDKRGYEEWDSAEDILSDQILDSLCGGDQVAKSAVDAAIDAFRDGNSMSDTFGKAMDAAVQEIPNVVREEFLKQLLGESFLKGINIYQDTVGSANAQGDYAISLLQERMSESVDDLVLLLTAEEISAEDLRECAYMVEDIYNLVAELEYRFSLSMPVEEWKMLNTRMYADAAAYENHLIRKHLYETYLQVEPDKLQDFMAEKSCTQEELKEIGLDVQEYYDLTFLTEYAPYLDLQDECQTLRSMDYAQMSETSKRNAVLGALNSAFGNFLTDMVMSNVIENDVEKVWRIYQFTDACEKALAECRGGFDGLQGILKDVNFMVYELYNTIYTTGDAACSLEEQNYMWFIFCDYYQGDRPTLDKYRERIDEYCKDVRAYRVFLGEYIIPAQKSILNMGHEVNASYIRSLENEKRWMDDSLYKLTQVYDAADTINSEKAIADAYCSLIDLLVEKNSFAPDTKVLRKSMSVQDVGGCEVFIASKEEKEIDEYGEPFYVELQIAGLERLRIYSYGMNVCKIVVGDNDYVTYGMGQYGLVISGHVSDTNIKDLDNADNVWYENWNLAECNDYFSYATNGLFELSCIPIYPEKEDELINKAVLCFRKILK